MCACTSCNICICIQFRVCIFYQALEVHRVSAHYCAQDLLVFHCTGCTGLLVHWYTVQCTVYQCTNSVHGALFSPHITGAPLLVFSPHITDSEHSTTPFIHVAPSRIQSAWNVNSKYLERCLWLPCKLIIFMSSDDDGSASGNADGIDELGCW